jgi:uncharacterized protein
MNNSQEGKWIDDFTPKELVINVYFSQGLFLVIAIVIAYFFDVPFPWNLKDRISGTDLILAVATGLFLPFLSIELRKRLPTYYLDDGGINEKIFSSLSYPHIFVLTGIIAFAEEWLFRGILQSLLGLVITSLVFSMLHVRYIKKPLLFSIVTALSFWLGLLYELTETIWVPFLAHFLIDFISGSWIAREYKKDMKDSDNGV